MGLVRIRCCLLPALLACLLGAPSGTLGQQAAPTAHDDALSRRTLAVSRTVMSPFCPGKTIDSCPSPRAQAWRQDIRRWLAEGSDAAEIRARLQARTPAFDLAGRPGAGWDWTLPVGAMALATLGLWLVARRLRPARSSPASEPDGATTGEARPATKPDPLDARLDAELSAFER